MSAKSVKVNKTLYRIIRFLSLGIIGYSIAGLIFNFHDRGDINYSFILIQSVLLFILTFIPTLVERLFKINLPILIEVIFLLFSTACIMLGEIFEFYIKISWWDNLLHTFSGSFIAIIGFVIIYFLNEKKGVNFRLSPGFIALFCFCFAMTCESIWEIFEFVVDGIFGSNMQRFKDNLDFTPFVGRDALHDTMFDIILTVIGAGCFSIISFLDLKLRKDSRLREYLEHADKDAIKAVARQLNLNELEDALLDIKQEKLKQTEEIKEESSSESCKS